MQPVFEANKSELDDFASYAAPTLIQMSGMARRAKFEFAAYLIEMVAADLMESHKCVQKTRKACGKLNCET